MELNDINWVAKTFDVWVDGIKIIDNMKFSSIYATEITDIYFAGGGYGGPNSVYIDYIRLEDAAQTITGTFGRGENITIITESIYVADLVRDQVSSFDFSIKAQAGERKRQKSNGNHLRLYYSIYFI